MKTKTDVKAGRVTIIAVFNYSSVHQSSKGCDNGGNTAIVAQNAQIGSSYSVYAPTA